MRYYWIVAILFLTFAAATLTVWAYWAGHSLEIFNYWAPKGPNGVAAWGDSFGGFNALFGALGFAAVLATLIAQIRTSIEQQKDQHRQRFDATFFEMIRMIDQLREELSFQYSNDYKKENKGKTGLSLTKRGRHAIPQAMSEMRFWIGKIKGDKTAKKKQICEKYMTYVHGRYESRLGPYFRMIFTIMNKIKSDDILTKKEKIYYGNLLRSQLSQYEVSLIAINSTSPISGNLSELIEEFRFLKYLPGGVTRNALQCVFKAETFLARND